MDHEYGPLKRNFLYQPGHFGLLKGTELFFLQNPETSLLLKPLGVFEIHVPPLETSPNKVKLIWIDFMIDSIWFELIWFSYYHHVRPLFSGGCFFWKKTHPQKNWRSHFHFKLWRCKETPIRFPLHGVPIWRNIPPQGVNQYPSDDGTVDGRNPAQPGMYKTP